MTIQFWRTIPIVLLVLSACGRKDDAQGISMGPGHQVPTRLPNFETPRTPTPTPTPLSRGKLKGGGFGAFGTSRIYSQTSHYNLAISQDDFAPPVALDSDGGSYTLRDPDLLEIKP